MTGRRVYRHRKDGTTDILERRRPNGPYSKVLGRIQPRPGHPGEWLAQRGTSATPRPFPTREAAAAHVLG